MVGIKNATSASASDKEDNVVPYGKDAVQRWVAIRGLATLSPAKEAILIWTSVPYSPKMS